MYIFEGEPAIVAAEAAAFRVLTKIKEIGHVCWTGRFVGPSLPLSVA